MVVKPGLKTRLKNSRAQGFTDILLTLRLTQIQILPRFTASMDRSPVSPFRKNSCAQVGGLVRLLDGSGLGPTG